MIQFSLACSEKKSKRSAVGIYRAPVQDINEPGVSGSDIGDITGAIVASFNNSVDQSLYQSRVKKFTSSFMMPDDSEFGLGEVSADYENISTEAGTGIRFNLTTCLPDGNEINPNTSYPRSQLSVSKSSLVMYMKDSHVVANPDQYSPFEITGYTHSASVISGKSMVLVFENSLAEITFDGNYDVDNDWFAGKVSFKNKVNFSSQGNIESGTLGSFYVPMNQVSANCL